MGSPVQSPSAVDIVSHLACSGMHDALPNREKILFCRGVSAIAHNDPTRVMWFWNELVAANPRQPAYWTGRALARYAFFDPDAPSDETIHDLSSAIAIHKQNRSPLPFLMRAQLNDERREAGVIDNDQAHNQIISDLTTAISLKPSHDAYLLRGAARWIRGEHKAAIRNWEKAIAIDDSNAAPYYHMAITHAQLGDLHASLTCFLEATDHPMQIRSILALLELVNMVRPASTTTPDRVASADR